MPKKRKSSRIQRRCPHIKDKDNGKPFMCEVKGKKVRVNNKGMCLANDCSLR